MIIGAYKKIANDVHHTNCRQSKINAEFIENKNLELLLSDLKDRDEKYLILTTVGGMVSADGKVAQLTEVLNKIVSLDKFNLDGVYGEFTNWEEFGQWMHKFLIAGRDILDETTKIKILELVKGIEDPIEKAKIVYEFMQNKI